MPVLFSVTLYFLVLSLVSSDGDKPCIQTVATMPEKNLPLWRSCNVSDDWI
jgi:hypothetical protein